MKATVIQIITNEQMKKYSGWGYIWQKKECFGVRNIKIPTLPVHLKFLRNLKGNSVWWNSRPENKLEEILLAVTKAKTWLPLCGGLPL